MARFSFLILFGFLLPAFASEPGAEINSFLSDAFEETPAAHDILLTSDLRLVMRDILHHDSPLTRVKYWRSAERTAWVLDEIGKERPITVGIVIDRGRIERVRVLIYRESRGREVQSPAFTGQFHGAGLDQEKRLDRTIDGISGATLSVRALQKLARLSLLLHRRALTGEQP